MPTGAITSFATGTYTVTRRAAGTIVDGKRVDGASSTLSNVSMCIQPVGGRDLKALPEGQRPEESRVIYTLTELFTRTPANAPDVVTIDGEDWLVTKVERWQAFGDTHYRAFAQRQGAPV